MWSEGIAGKILEAGTAGGAVYLWALWEKYKDRILLNTAAATDRPVSVAQVKQMVRDGLNPPASVPQNRVPYLQGQKPDAGYSTDFGWPPLSWPLPPPPPPPDRDPGRS